MDTQAVVTHYGYPDSSPPPSQYPGGLPPVQHEIPEKEAWPPHAHTTGRGPEEYHPHAHHHHPHHLHPHQHPHHHEVTEKSSWPQHLGGVVPVERLEVEEKHEWSAQVQCESSGIPRHQPPEVEQPSWPAQIERTEAAEEPHSIPAAEKPSWPAQREIPRPVHQQRIPEKPVWYREIMRIFLTELECFKSDYQKDEQFYNALRGLLIISLERAEVTVRSKSLKALRSNSHHHSDQEDDDSNSDDDEVGSISSNDADDASEENEPLEGGTSENGGENMAGFQEHVVENVENLSLSENPPSAAHSYPMGEELHDAPPAHAFAGGSNFETKPCLQGYVEDKGESTLPQPDDSVPRKEEKVLGFEGERREMFQCPFCKKALAHRQAMFHHVGSCEHRYRELRCGDCGSIFFTEYSFQDHRQLVHGHPRLEVVNEYSDGASGDGTVVKIEIAPDFSTGMMESSAHPQDFFPGNNKELLEDFESQTSKEALKEEKRIFKCSVCGKGYIRKKRLEGHLRNKHGMFDTNDSGRRGKGRKFQCTFCTKTCSRKSDLEIHVSLHGPEDPDIKCSTCGKCFTHRAILSKHIRETCHYSGDKKGRDGRMFQCNICQKTCSRKSDFEIHTSLHGPEDPNLKCLTCGKCFTHKALLSKHMLMMSHAISDCKICNIQFTSYDMRLSHMREFHPRPGINKETNSAPQPCKICGLEFPSSALRVTHVKECHPGQEAYEFWCEKCNLSYPSEKQLGRHLQRHKSDLIPSVCDICGKSFTTRYMLRHHMGLHQPSGSYRCESCPKVFHTEYQLRVHVKGHTLPKAVCELCGKSVWKYHMKLHLEKVHPQSVTDHACDICSKVFKRQDLLQQHRKRHFVQVNLSCPTCGKAFKSDRGLQIHMILHTGNLPFKCQQCDKAYADKRHLRQHMMIHNNDRRHPCSFCPKAFFDKKTLEQHTNTHTGRRPYACQECGDSFAYSGALFTHRKLKHKKVKAESMMM